MNKRHQRKIVNSLFYYTSEYYDIPIEKIISKCRLQNLVNIRQNLSHFMTMVLDMTLSEAGKYLGGRDHTTVLYARKQIIDAEFNFLRHKKQDERLNEYYEYMAKMKTLLKDLINIKATATLTYDMDALVASIHSHYRNELLGMKGQQPNINETWIDKLIEKVKGNILNSEVCQIKK